MTSNNTNFNYIKNNNNFNRKIIYGIEKSTNDISSKNFFENYFEFPNNFINSYKFYPNNNPNFIFKPSIIINSFKKKKCNNELLSFFIFENDKNICLSHLNLFDFLTENNNENKYKIFNDLIYKCYYNLIKLNNNLNNCINFNSFIMPKFKIYILIQEKFSIVTVYRPNSPFSFSKMQTLFLLTSFINYCCESIENLSLLYNNYQNDNIQNNFIDIHSISINNNNNIFSILSKFEIYGKLLIKYLSVYFTQLYDYPYSLEEFVYKNFQFLNIYIINLNYDFESKNFSPEIIFNLRSAEGNKYLNIKLYKNKLVWENILFYSKKLLNDYINENKNNSSNEYQYYIIKLEYKSCYPRICFLIKFIPILKGVCTVYVYSHNKISNKYVENPFLNINDKRAVTETILTNNIVNENNNNNEMTNENNNNKRKVVYYKRIGEDKMKEYDVLFVKEFLMNNEIEVKFNLPPKMMVFDILLRRCYLLIKNINDENIYFYSLKNYNYYFPMNLLDNINTIKINLNNNFNLSDLISDIINEFTKINNSNDKNDESDILDDYLNKETKLSTKKFNNAIFSIESRKPKKIQNFLKLIKISFFDIIKLILNKIEKNEYKEESFIDFSTDSLFINDAFIKEPSLCLDKFELPNDKYIKVTINQSKEVSIISSRPGSNANLMVNFNENLYDILDNESEGVFVKKINDKKKINDNNNEDFDKTKIFNDENNNNNNNYMKKKLEKNQIKKKKLSMLNDISWANDIYNNNNIKNNYYYYSYNNNNVITKRNLAENKQKNNTNNNNKNNERYEIFKRSLINSYKNTLKNNT